MSLCKSNQNSGPLKHVPVPETIGEVPQYSRKLYRRVNFCGAGICNGHEF
jgi:hypothetical protein